jgi:hypothetical protein
MATAGWNFTLKNLGQLKQVTVAEPKEAKAIGIFQSLFPNAPNVRSPVEMELIRFIGLRPLEYMIWARA